MSTAESLIINAENYATTQANNAYNYTALVFNLVDQLLTSGKIQTTNFNPSLDFSGMITPSDIKSTDAGFVRKGSQSIVPSAFPDPSAIKYQGRTSIPAFNPTTPDPVFTGTRPTVADAVTAMQEAYDTSSPDVRNKINTAVNSWMLQYCPGYSDGLLYLQDQINRVLQGGTALTDVIQDAIYNKARQQIDNESKANQRQATKALAKRGFKTPAIVMNAALNQVMRSAADRAAVNATETAVERAKIEVQNLQFFVGASNNLQQIMVNSFVQFAGIISHAEQSSMGWGEGIGKTVIEESGAEVNIYKSDVDKYLGDWTGRRTEAETYTATVHAYAEEIGAAKAVLQAQVEQITAQVEVAKTEIEANVSAREIELKEDQIQSEIWRNTLSSQIAAQNSIISENELKLKASEIPYEGLLKTRIAQSELNEKAYEAASHVAQGVAASIAGIAQAAMSTINGVGVQSDTSSTTV
jgi:hypothetical protein